MESGAVELAFLVLIAAFYIFRFFINKWNALHRAKWQFEINNEMQLPFLISVARLKISRTPSGSVTTLEEDLVMAEELLADGGVLQKQRDYEENSWWFWWVDWWVHGMLSNTLVADQIAIMDKSISSGNKAT